MLRYVAACQPLVRVSTSTVVSPVVEAASSIAQRRLFTTVQRAAPLLAPAPASRGQGPSATPNSSNHDASDAVRPRVLGAERMNGRAMIYGSESVAAYQQQQQSAREVFASEMAVVNSPPLPSGAAAIKASLVPLLHGGPNAATKGDKFAIVMVNNIQYKVTVGDTIIVQRLAADIGSTIHLKKVLAVGGARFTAIGRPLLSQCIVSCVVEEHKRMRGQLNMTPYKGRHATAFRYNRHTTTVLRVLSVEYDPCIVGEIDKNSGILIPAAEREPDVDKPAAGCYFAEDVPAIPKSEAQRKL